MKSKSTNDSWKRWVAKRRWSEAEARSVVEAWRASGQRVQTFAREYGFGAWRLRYWAPRLPADSPMSKTPGSSRSSTQVKFVPAVLTGTTTGERAAVVIRLPDGIAVELHDVGHAGARDVGEMVACLRGVGS